MSDREQDLEQDLARWREQWQGGSPRPALNLAGLKRRARWRNWGLVLYLTLGFAGGTFAALAFTWVAVESGHWLDCAVAACIIALMVWALTFELRSLRGLWQPSAETPAAFLDLSIDRCRRWLRVVDVSWWALGIEVLLFIPWILSRFRSPSGNLPVDGRGMLWSFALLAVMLSLVAVALLILRSWARRRLTALTELRRGLEESG